MPDITTQIYKDKNFKAAAVSILHESVSGKLLENLPKMYVASQLTIIVEDLWLTNLQFPGRSQSGDHQSISSDI